MDFSLNDIQSMLLDSVQKFINNDYDFDKRQSYSDSEQGFSSEVWTTFAELGWTAIPFDEEDGGIGGGPVDLMIVMEQFGRGMIVEPYLANIVLAGGVLRRVATTEQKSRWLEPLIGGELQAALAFVEPQGRYDIANVATSASKEGDDWVINGSKSVVFNGGNAGLLIVPARTSGEQSNTDGITLFAVETGADGVNIQSYKTVDGHQAADISFDGVKLPDTNRLGNVDGGFAVLDAVIDDATLAVCAEAVGIMRILTEKTVEYSKNRVQFGVPIGSFQALQHRMVDMFTACEQTYSLLVWASMTASAGGDDAKRAVSSIKYQVGTAGRKVGEEAVQLHGGMGVTWELDVAHYFKRLTAIGQILGNADLHLDRLAAG
ncbi:MAG: acyl-CoA dehydrogenase family protein [Woeseiaceae bacterium]|nr:acyl-CoA dehydrogenase family protein [Woeseiaceae bacterium]